MLFVTKKTARMIMCVGDEEQFFLKKDCKAILLKRLFFIAFAIANPTTSSNQRCSFLLLPFPYTHTHIVSQFYFAYLIPVCLLLQSFFYSLTRKPSTCFHLLLSWSFSSVGDLFSVFVTLDTLEFKFGLSSFPSPPFNDNPHSWPLQK